MLTCLKIEKFRELGFIQEINRRILHPCGLALAVRKDEDGIEQLLGVVVMEEGPEGVVFSDDIASKPDFEKKRQTVDGLINSNRETREEKFGFNIQPTKVNE